MSNKWAEIVNKEPDAWFVRELKKIDPEMRVVWGAERYFRNEWAIERKMEAERYWLAYESLLSDGGDRFIDQPIFDMSQPILDESGEIQSYAQIGTRKYDLAPEYEHIAFRKTLDQSTLDRIKELCWKHAHPEEAAAADAAEKAQREIDQKTKRIDGAMEGVEEAFLDTRKKVQFGAGPTRSENK